jgi:hypothetical protein
VCRAKSARIRNHAHVHGADGRQPVALGGAACGHDALDPGVLIDRMRRASEAGTA